MKLEISMAKLIEDKEKNRYTYKLFVKNIEGELEEFEYFTIDYNKCEVPFRLDARSETLLGIKQRTNWYGFYIYKDYLNLIERLKGEVEWNVITVTKQ